MSDTIKGYIATILTIIIIGFSFLFVKVALADGNPVDILAHRFGIAFLVMLPLVFFKRKELTLKKTDWRSVLFMALLYPIAIFGLQIWGLHFISSAEVGIIQATQPILTIIIAMILLKEKISFRQKVFTLISVMGALFIFLMQGIIASNSSFLGYFASTLSCLALALYVVLVRKYKQQLSVFQLTFYCIGFGAVFFYLLAIIRRMVYPESSHFMEPFGSPQYVIALLYLGTLSSLVTLALTNYSYTKIEASKLSVFSNFVPVIAVFAGVIILKEQLNWSHIVGALIILCGVVGVNSKKK